MDIILKFLNLNLAFSMAYIRFLAFGFGFFGFAVIVFLYFVFCIIVIVFIVFFFSNVRLHAQTCWLNYEKICMTCTFFSFMICLGDLSISTQINTFNIFSSMLVLKSFALTKIPYNPGYFWRSLTLIFLATEVYAIQNHKRLITFE